MAAATMSVVAGLQHAIPSEGLWDRGFPTVDLQRHSGIRMVGPKRRSRAPPLLEAVTNTRIVPICSTSGRLFNQIEGTSYKRAPNSRNSQTIHLKAVVTVGRKSRPSINEQLLDKLDVVADRLGLANVLLQLVSTEIDPKTGTGKRSAPSVLCDWGEKADVVADKIQYTVEWKVPGDFGSPESIVIRNNHQNEFYLETICIRSNHDDSNMTFFPCHSWIQPEKLSTHPVTERVFFSNRVYLPSDTPAGLKALREKELKSLRGDGKGLRKDWERIYDYDTYNDLGDPDRDSELFRPALGGNSNLPYPRRCRTGRPPTKTDPNLESRVEVGGRVYIPRDERFEPIKESTFIDNCMKGLMHKLTPAMAARLTNTNFEFKTFGDIDRLYSDGLQSSFRSSRESKREISSGILSGPSMSDFIRQLPFINNDDTYSKYPLPDVISKDKFAWMRDEEFGRQVLAGQNPCAIERLKAFPPVSELDPQVYGPPESAITAEHIEGELEGLTVKEALQQKRLFILDYHDLFMPFVQAINSLEGRKTYATRTFFFLNKEGILKPLAVELSLPPASKGERGSKRVFTPSNEPTKYWLWQLAKAHVCSNDSGHHQLVSHWLRTHACTEPYVLATHRQLSKLHPVYQFLQPHLRYTLEINGSARMNLISADGVIASSIDTSDADPVTKLMFKLVGTLSLESCFTPGKYSMEMSSAAYKQKWRFDMEALPEDLIRRGMAEREPNSRHGLKLLVEDYPYAADGLLLWSALEEWVADYVNIYYGKDASSVVNDYELQKWWAEIRFVGHADKKHEPWWPLLQTKEDLIQILTNLVWIMSGQHAAVNFGQFTYGGYIPNHPCLTRKLVPEEGSLEFAEFTKNPQSFFLSTLPNPEQATAVMMIIEALSAHSPDEEYLGERKSRWSSNRAALNAFQKFTEKIRSVEREIVSRNKNPKLRNRSGAGVPPYELLFPRSGPGITGRGVPNSVSI